MRTFTLTALIALVVLVGCGKGSDPNGTITETTRKETTLPSGWKEIATSGIALAFPPGWNALDLTQSTMDKSADAMFGKDPKYESMRAQIKSLAASGVFKVFVFEDATVGKGGFANNCNVTKIEAPAGMTPATAAEQTKSQLAAMVAPGTEVKTETVTLKAGTAAKVTSQLKTASPTMPPVRSLAYLLVHGGQLYAITFSCGPADEDKVRTMAEQVMDTFRFTE
jgi:hypothetical protein